MNHQLLLDQAYRGKKVLITGHTGFKGSWLLAWLNGLGATIKGYSLAPLNKDDLYNTIAGDSLCNSVIADICDKARVMREIEDFAPDFIFHLAAQPLVRKSYIEPDSTFEVNVNGTLNVLEALRRMGKPCIAIFITTDKVYDNIESDYSYRESDKLGGKDPYSASKAAAEILIASYRHSFFNPEQIAQHGKSIASARAGNVIGGGDWSADRLIPDVIKALKSGAKISVRNPESVRPWQHVLEPISGYLVLGAKLASAPGDYCEAWNFGPSEGDVKNVRELVEDAISIWGTGTYMEQEMADAVHEAKLLRLDISHTIAKLNWQPKWNSSEAIQKTIEWYRNVDEELKSRKIVDEQISKYQL